jgi:hypothetical protein
MPLSTSKKSGLILLAIAAISYIAQAQRSENPAQISVGAPLPVHVTNLPTLPEGFTPGSHWRFTTWTTPSVLTFTATVNRTSGAWAHLSVRNESGGAGSGWYYIPQMQGSWQPQ